MLMILSSCSFLHKKSEYGLLSPNELKDGELILRSEILKKEKCRKIAFIFPYGDSHVDEIDKTIEEMLKLKPEVVALGNVTHEISVKGFPLFYLQRCVTIKGRPLVYKH